MSKDAVTSLLGSNYVTVGAREDADQKNVEVIRYQKKEETLFLYFREQKLVQWGDISILNNIPPANTR